jgi:hypothetical protein
VRKLAALVVVVLLVPALGGCGLLLAQVATDFSFTVETPSIQVAPGAWAPVHVKVKRALPVDVVPLPVTVSLHDPPAGVSAAPLTLPSGIDEDDLILTVQAGTPAGGPFAVKVRATNGTKTHEATVRLTVGSP